MQHAVMLLSRSGGLGTGFVVDAPEGAALVTTAHLFGTSPASSEWGRWDKSVTICSGQRRVSVDLFDRIGKPAFKYASMSPHPQIHDAICLPLPPQVIAFFDSAGWPAVISQFADLPELGARIYGFGFRHFPESRIIRLLECGGDLLTPDFELYGRSTAKALPGQSGGPVFDRSSRLCGMFLGQDESISVLLSGRLIYALAAHPGLGEIAHRDDDSGDH